MRLLSNAWYVIAKENGNIIDATQDGVRKP